MSSMIEIGKQYQVSNRWKKSVEEIEHFVNDKIEGRLFISVLWRGGEYLVTPQNEDECEWLQCYIDDSECSDTLCVTDFEEYELISTWDGCSEDMDFSNQISEAFDEETLDEWREGYYEEHWDWLEENGWHPEDMECYIYNGVIVEEYEV